VGGRVTKVQPVAVGDRLYAIHDGKVMALDAATGRTVIEYGTVDGPRELLLDGGRLVVADKNGIRSFAPDSLAPAWEVSGIDARRIVAGDGSVFCLVGSTLVTLDAATGKERWRAQNPKLQEAATCSYRGGVLAAERSTWMDDPAGCGLQVFSGADGKLLWEKDYKPSMTHYMEARAFFARGRLWILGEASKVVGLDPKTGREERALPTRGKHCASPVATERFFLAPECDFTDFETGEVTKARMFKSACRLPFIPANGLLYTFPVQCECYPMLRGYMALGKTAPRPETDLPLLKRGAAPAVDAAPAEPAKDEWPTYRHDAYRSGATPSPLREGELKKSWSVELARPRTGRHGDEWDTGPFVRGTLTAPVAAGGLVVAAVPHEHRVVAVDAKTGAARWSFTAGGRIDTPPTLADGLCVFGSHDGHVYALDAATGEPAWRYRAAPQEARVLAYGQVESLWPVPGSVLVDAGVAYAVAGRHPLSDGGLRAVALRVRTGELVWQKRVDEIDVKNWYGQMLATKKKVGLDFEPVDLFVKDGESVSMSRWRFDPRNGDFKLAIASPEYEAPGLAVPRGLWGYGIRQTKMVQDKPPAAFHAGKLHVGLKGDVAIVLAGGVPVAADEKGELRIGERRVALGAAPVPDGLAAAHGRLYAALQDGTLVCLE
jgi:outer membrane protein assembly factor BamB